MFGKMANSINGRACSAEEDIEKFGEDMVKKVLNTSTEYMELEPSEIPSSAPPQILFSESFTFPPLSSTYSEPEKINSESGVTPTSMFPQLFSQIQNHAPARNADILMKIEKALDSYSGRNYSNLRGNTPSAPPVPNFLFGQRSAARHAAYNNIDGMKNLYSSQPPVAAITPLKAVRPVLGSSIINSFGNNAKAVHGINRKSGQDNNFSSSSTNASRRPQDLLGCNYCKAIGKEYRNHSKEMCPALTALRPCRICNASGANNHTLTHCPQKEKKLLKKKNFSFSLD